MRGRFTDAFAGLARPLLAGLFILASVQPSHAERYKLVFQPGSEDGQFVELISHQLDSTKKVEQMEWFLKTYPNSLVVSHFLEWLQGYFLRSNQFQKSLDAGVKLLEKHPLDFDAALRCQKAAQQLNDPPLIATWDARMLKLSEEVLAGQPPPDLDPAAWAQTREFAKGLLAQRDYQEFRKALDAKGHRAKIQALEDLLERNPNTPYISQVWIQLLNSYRAVGESAKALHAADKVLANDPSDPDALLLSSQMLLDRRTNYPKIVSNAQRVLQIVETRAKPEGYSDEDWEKRKDYYVGSANLLIGNTYVNQSSFALADKHLRAALQHLKGVDQTEAAILFYLGWANYHLENYKEAAAFFKQCVSISGPFAEQAVRNLNVMRSERRIYE